MTAPSTARTCSNPPTRPLQNLEQRRQISPTQPDLSHFSLSKTWRDLETLTIGTDLLTMVAPPIRGSKDVDSGATFDETQASACKLVVGLSTLPNHPDSGWVAAGGSFHSPPRSWVRGGTIGGKLEGILECYPRFFTTIRSPSCRPFSFRIVPFCYTSRHCLIAEPLSNFPIV